MSNSATITYIHWRRSNQFFLVLCRLNTVSHTSIRFTVLKNNIEGGHVDIKPYTGWPQFHVSLNCIDMSPPKVKVKVCQKHFQLKTTGIKVVESNLGLTSIFSLFG